jgi:hypothetical protein
MPRIFCLHRSASWLISRSTNAGQKRPAPRVKGAIAPLGERYNGIVEVIGSIPIGSTK